MTTTAEADRLMGYMPILVRDAGVSDWERKFCASMVRRSKRQAFRPSEKQVSVMARLVEEFQDRSMRGDVVED